MPVVLLGVGLALGGTGLTVLQAADSTFWTVAGWVLLAGGVIAFLWAGVARYFRREPSDRQGPAAFDTSGGGETTVEGGSVKGYKRVSRVAGGIARFINVKIRRR